MEKLRHRKNDGSFSIFFMMLPSIFLLFVVSVYPFLWLFKYVFYDYNGFKAYFVGLDNFQRVLGDTIYWKSVIHTFEYSFQYSFFYSEIGL